MGVKDGLLALLAAGPGYGYQLKVDFEEAIGGAWSLNVGQVYTSLQRLERDGLVAEVEGDDDGEERRSYAATAAGREHLATWLATPVERTIESRDEVAMKSLLAATSPGHDPLQVIASQRTATMTALQDHTRRKARRPGLAEAIHLDRVILSCRAELDWLDLAEQRLEAVRSNGHHVTADQLDRSDHTDTTDATDITATPQGDR